MRFHIAGLCFTDATGISFQHDLSLVVLSYVVAVCGSYTALEMIERWRSAQAGSSACWQLASASALGGSIWSMHFIAMLAVEIVFPVSYAPGMTLLSLFVAIAAVGGGLQMLRGNISWPRVCGAGFTVGLGVAAMHYIGMSALRFSGTLAYTPTFWSLSILIGIAAATVALWLSLSLKTKRHRAAAALVMGVAIGGMHYTGMAATVFEFDPLAHVSPGVHGALLATVVAAMTMALILYALIFVATDRRLKQAEQREAGVLRQANAALELGREQFNTALSHMSQGLTFFDCNQKLIVCNPRYGEIYRLTPDLMKPGTCLSDILDHRLAQGTLPDMTRQDFLARREAYTRAGKPYDITEEMRTGQIIATHHKPLENGGWVVTHEDVTERRRAEASIAFMARHDTLTRLPNRAVFHERLEQAIGLLGRGDDCAVLCLDLDHFKLINDTMGHAAGDVLLQAAADRLQSCVREVDTVARLGGDEFAIIQLAVKQPNDVELLANRVVAAFEKPFDLDGQQVTIGVSIGAAIAPGDGVSFDKLLKNADIALHLAKTDDRGSVRFFESAMDAELERRRILELDLRSALARNELELFYQPLIQLATGELTEFEALLRWRHPVRGLVSPVDFIPLAEQTGLIVSIGEWVLRTACATANTWPSDIKVAVNLSTVQFKHGNIVPTVRAALEASGLSPHRLELEITESILLQESEATLSALNQLREIGIAIALDDFGTGYSSLSYLHRFPFDKIKIDQSFVRNMATSHGSMSIVRAIAGLGHSLNMKTTAEGVETLAQLNMLREEGCTQAQGYFISRPKPAGEILALIASLQVAVA